MADENPQYLTPSKGEEGVSGLTVGLVVYGSTLTGRFPPSRLPPHVVFETSAYDDLRKERNALRLCLIVQARMLASWAPECFPAGADGKIHFVRALMESAAQEMSEAAKVPYPVPDAAPINNPVAGAIETLRRFEHTLNTLNGVYARDTDQRGPAVEWQVDVARDLTDVGALLASLRLLVDPPAAEQA